MFQPIPSVPTLDSELLPQYSTGDLIDFVKVRVDFIKVRGWRHKLQKTFLSHTKALPKEEVRLCSPPLVRGAMLTSGTAGDAPRE
jgi:hypothetical protein